MKLSKLLANLPQITAQNTLHPNTDILAVEFDSRAVAPGTLFVALAGAQADGHQYVEQAVERGAAAILVDEHRSTGFERLGVPVLTAKHTRAVLGPLAAAFYEDPSAKLTVIGITGTNGKTTTAFMLEQLCRSLGRSPGIIGTVSYRWADKTFPAPNTTPESLTLQRLMAQMLADGVDTVIMEVSSHGLTTHRVDGVHFDAAIYTNLTQDHLDFHGTMQAYAEAKASLFSRFLPLSLKPRKAAILNLDDPLVRALYDQLCAEAPASTRVIGTSIQGQLDAHGVALSAQVDLHGARFSYKTPAGRYELFSPMLGRFNLSNMLQALLAIEAIGVDLSTLNPESLARWSGVPGRLERVPRQDDEPAVFVDYAHTPDALERALETLDRHREGDLWVVFGCGGDRDRTKRPIMGKVAASLANAVYLTSDNPRSEDPKAILDDIAAGIQTPPAILAANIDRQEAILSAVAWAKPKDVILIAGKGHETYQEQHGKRRPFDDRAVAAQALEARRLKRSATLSLEQLRDALGATLINAPDPHLIARDLTTDSRKIATGALFVALVGERFDGHDFLPQAVQAGAAAALVSAPRAELALPQLVVPDTLVALQRLSHVLWRAHRASANLADKSGVSIALTGSNGKTTTKEIMRALWHHFGPTYATPGNFNNEIGLPLTICDLPTTAKHVILEMGAGKPGDIAELIDIAPADLRVITSIGAAHLERLGGLDGVRAVKAGIFKDADATTVAIVPEHERHNLIPADFPGRVITFGASPQADLCIASSQPAGEGTGQLVTLTYQGHAYPIHLPLIGPHHASNLAAAFATLIAADKLPTHTHDLLRLLDVPGGRWRRIELGQRHIIDDAYNANPASMRASFQAFMQWQATQPTPGPRVAIIGTMLELGDDAKNWHLEVIRFISTFEELNALIVVGPFATPMAELARELASANLTVIAADDVEAAAQALATLPQGLFFLKASRGARLERILDIVQDGQA